MREGGGGKRMKRKTIKVKPATPIGMSGAKAPERARDYAEYKASKRPWYVKLWRIFDVYS